ncbi:hypothetical protein EDB89DRAFT_1901703 [Lactarius sanguifluus]|nr:hypothetical protein EDB89DRAFT_1901703 [Lactarius sanguifluus]
MDVIPQNNLIDDGSGLFEGKKTPMERSSEQLTQPQTSTREATCALKAGMVVAWQWWSRLGLGSYAATSKSSRSRSRVAEVGSPHSLWLALLITIIATNHTLHSREDGEHDSTKEGAYRSSSAPLRGGMGHCQWKTPVLWIVTRYSDRRVAVTAQPGRDLRNTQKYAQDDPQWNREVRGATAVLEDLLEKWKEEPPAQDHVRVGRASLDELAPRLRLEYGDPMTVWLTDANRENVTVAGQNRAEPWYSKKEKKTTPLNVLILIPVALHPTPPATTAPAVDNVIKCGHRPWHNTHQNRCSTWSPNYATATSTPCKPITTQSLQDRALMQAASDEDNGGTMVRLQWSTVITAERQRGRRQQGNTDSGDKDTSDDSKAASMTTQRQRGGVRWQGQWQRKCDDRTVMVTRTMTIRCSDGTVRCDDGDGMVQWPRQRQQRNDSGGEGMRCTARTVRQQAGHSCTLCV